MPRRLVVLFDGTWNKARTGTNVERMHRCIAAQDAQGDAQLCLYIKGVGVARGLAHLAGGAFGWGLSGNVKQGYQWLAQTWQPGDEIWMFGFSRGAYSARSLAGLIRKCGLLRADVTAAVSAKQVDAAYALYRNALHPDDAQMIAFRTHYSHAVGIRFIGVWDTVGSLGIPGVAAWFPFARSRYAFHDTELSGIVAYAYQALALDEERADFAPAKWTRPDAVAKGQSPSAWKPEQIEVEQRWFCGAHADIGGGEQTDGAGHAPDPLPDLTLDWMQSKALAAGLALASRIAVASEAILAPPNDSWAQFMFGAYKWFKPRVPRTLGGGVNETIDASVWRKWHAQAQYRPAALRAAIDSGIAPLDAQRLN